MIFLDSVVYFACLLVGLFVRVLSLHVCLFEMCIPYLLASLCWCLYLSIRIHHLTIVVFAKGNKTNTHPSKAHMLELQRQRHPCQVRKIIEKLHEKRIWMNNRICWDQKLFSISSFTTSCITVFAPIAPLPLLHVLLRKEICTTPKKTGKS